MIYSVEKRRDENGVQILFHTIDGLSGLEETSWSLPYSVKRTKETENHSSKKRTNGSQGLI